MRLIKPSFEILEQGPDLLGVFKQIELAGRTCYKSLDKITDNSAEDFVNRMIASKHYAMLEHGTIYLAIPCEFNGNQHNESWKESKYNSNPYSKVRREYVESERNYVDFITTNLRVLIENNWLDDLQYLCEPTEFHEKRVTVRFTTDRGVSHEFVRHRVFSFAQESTRYCNYSKDKFGNELTFIIPCWVDLEEGCWGVGHDFVFGFFYHIIGENDHIYPKTEQEIDNLDFLQALKSDENKYLRLIKRGKTPQQARQILPNALKTELVMTGFISDWQHFFDLRARGTTGAPHPDAKALAEPLMHEFETRNLI